MNGTPACHVVLLFMKQCDPVCLENRLFKESFFINYYKAAMVSEAAVVVETLKSY
jgi:hypothetical protein